jgi:hypothetical protein
LISAATFVVLLLTLIAVKRYTQAAHKQALAARDQVSASERTAKAAIAQVEAAMMPCMVLMRFQNNDPKHSVDLQNVGSGPALNLAWRVEAYSEYPGGAVDVLFPGNGGLHKPVYPVNYAETIGVERRQLLNFAIMVIEYSSMSGKRYRSRVEIPHSGDLRNFTFEEIPT